MDDKERFERGVAKRREVLGDPWVERSMKGRTPLNEEFVDLITRYAWGEIWTRPHFDQRTRRIMVLATTIALGRWEEYRLHLRAALTEGGFSIEDVKEIIHQQAIYCGVPSANTAIKEAADVIAEIKRTSQFEGGSRD